MIMKKPEARQPREFSADGHFPDGGRTKYDDKFHAFVIRSCIAGSKDFCAESLSESVILFFQSSVITLKIKQRFAIFDDSVLNLADKN